MSEYLARTGNIVGGKEYRFTGRLMGCGSLTKRPLAVEDDYVLIGFKEAEWTDKLELQR